MKFFWFDWCLLLKNTLMDKCNHFLFRVIYSVKVWQILKNCFLCSNLSSSLDILLWLSMAPFLHNHLKNLPLFSNCQWIEWQCRFQQWLKNVLQTLVMGQIIFEIVLRKSVVSVKKVLIKWLFMRKKVEQSFKRSPTKSLLIPTAQSIPLAQLFSMFVAKWSCFTSFYIVFSGLTLLFSTQKAYLSTASAGTATNRAANMTAATATVAWMRQRRRPIGWGRIRKKNVCAGS